MIAQGRAGHLGQAMLHADAGVAPTAWQASTFPAPLRQMLDVIHDGVNTAAMAPNPQASFALPNGQSVKTGDEVLTFVNRNLEPYRGYHIFMRALPDVLKARPKAQVVIVGGDEVSYGSAPEGAKGWKDTILNEVRDRLDMSRVHFMGKIPYDKFIALMQVSRAHAYLTYPFVLSWSMIEAMSAGAHVIGSATAPVQEVIQDGVNGTLVDFFDIAAWSAALTKALAHPDQFQTLRQAARQTALDRYDQSLLLPQMVNFVERHGPKP
jgi:glycosyltransferase involved in cell wall biosynthesis